MPGNAVSAHMVIMHVFIEVITQVFTNATMDVSHLEHAADALDPVIGSLRKFS